MTNFAKCRICFSETFDLRFVKNNFRIEQCCRCGLTQVTNSPPSSEIDSYYDEDFFTKFYDRLLNDPKRQAYEYNKFNFRLEEIEQFIPHKGKILDVGCSFGFFLDAARGKGWQPFGVEISEFAANYARNNFDLPVMTDLLEELALDSGYFDVIALWNVIEHVEKPTQLIEEAARILKEGGLLVLTTGNIDSPIAKLRKAKWRVLIPPIHLSYFSPRSIKHLLNSYNLEIIYQTCALPYEFLLKTFKALGICRKLYISDKMLVYARKIA